MRQYMAFRTKLHCGTEVVISGVVGSADRSSLLAVKRALLKQARIARSKQGKLTRLSGCAKASFQRWLDSRKKSLGVEATATDSNDHTSDDIHDDATCIDEDVQKDCLLPSRASRHAIQEDTYLSELMKLPKLRPTMHVYVLDLASDHDQVLNAALQQDRANFQHKLSTIIINNPHDFNDDGVVRIKDKSRSIMGLNKDMNITDVLMPIVQDICDKFELKCDIAAASVITSTGGPHQQRQALHCDYDQGKVVQCAEEHDLYPWTVLFGLHAYARLGLESKVESEGDRLGAVVLKQNQCVLFRGDVRHCGMNYMNFHRRAHFYLEPKVWDAKKNGKMRVVKKETETSLFNIDTDAAYDKSLSVQYLFEFVSTTVAKLGK